MVSLLPSATNIITVKSLDIQPGPNHAKPFWNSHGQPPKYAASTKLLFAHALATELYVKASSWILWTFWSPKTSNARCHWPAWSQEPIIELHVMALTSTFLQNILSLRSSYIWTSVHLREELGCIESQTLDSVKLGGYYSVTLFNINRLSIGKYFAAVFMAIPVVHWLLPRQLTTITCCSDILLDIYGYIIFWWW